MVSFSSGLPMDVIDGAQHHSKLSSCPHQRPLPLALDHRRSSHDILCWVYPMRPRTRGDDSTLFRLTISCQKSAAETNALTLWIHIKNDSSFPRRAGYKIVHVWCIAHAVNTCPSRNCWSPHSGEIFSFSRVRTAISPNSMHSYRVYRILSVFVKTAT
ncbi:hypothetical protein FA95DRAFT_633235 [Auriscalpium vulgare]|uniref:Uncharacterized protein n=1 Tax=Auriscalpium vulgare TaxID=40419 RepID=A0ACB8RCP3_9AGAM|nr:hypothetical protein FA95DRAFT_633235 [Auriscalpium vulgare]